MIEHRQALGVRQFLWRHDRLPIGRVLATPTVKNPIVERQRNLRRSACDKGRSVIPHPHIDRGNLQQHGCFPWPLWPRAIAPLTSRSVSSSLTSKQTCSCGARAQTICTQIHAPALNRSARFLGYAARKAKSRDAAPIQPASNNPAQRAWAIGKRTGSWERHSKLMLSVSERAINAAIGINTPVA